MYIYNILYILYTHTLFWYFYQCFPQELVETKNRANIGLTFFRWAQTQLIIDNVCTCLLPTTNQSSDSTQIDDCRLRKSPVFPSTDCKATVHVPRLCQDLLEACRTSGFVVCSQDSLTSTRKSQTTPAKSPIFPKSPKRSHNLPLSKSLVFIEADQGDDTETDRSPEYFKSPVFGRNAQHEMSSGSSEPQDGDCNLGFIFCSDESLTSSVRSTSSRPKSPVFPESPGLPKNLPTPEKSPTCKSPVFSETVGGRSGGRCASPVFGRIGRLRRFHRDAELRRSDSDGNLSTTGSPSQGLRQVSSGVKQSAHLVGRSVLERPKSLNLKIICVLFLIKKVGFKYIFQEIWPKMYTEWDILRYKIKWYIDCNFSVWYRPTFLPMPIFPIMLSWIHGRSSGLIEKASRCSATYLLYCNEFKDEKSVYLIFSMMAVDSSLTLRWHFINAFLLLFCLNCYSVFFGVL